MQRGEHAAQLEQRNSRFRAGNTKFSIAIQSPKSHTRAGRGSPRATGQLQRGEGLMRSYTAQDIITLPTLNTASAIALGQELLTANKAHTGLPQLIAARAAALEKAHSALCQALSNKPQDADPKRTRTTDHAEDLAFSALHDWLYAWCKLPTPEADQARTIYAVLFPDGLKFTRLPYKQEWAEAEAKLARITSDAYDTEIQKLGGKPLLDQLRATHKEYGESLGITLGNPDPSTTKIRETLVAFNRYLKAYVVAVTAHTDPDDPTSAALADELLSPLHHWETYVTVSAETEAPATQPATQPTAGVGSTGAQTTGVPTTN